MCIIEFAVRGDCVLFAHLSSSRTCARALITGSHLTGHKSTPSTEFSPVNNKEQLAGPFRGAAHRLNFHQLVFEEMDTIELPWGASVLKALKCFSPSIQTSSPKLVLGRCNLLTCLGREEETQSNSRFIYSV